MTPALGLGCAPLGNLYRAVTDDDAKATVDAAWHAGVRYFDTAPLYGHGLAERRLGGALAARPRDDYTLSTKVGRRLVAGVDPATIFVDVPPVRPVFDFTYDGVLRSIDDSLARLGTDRIDVALVHDPDDHEEEAIAGAFPALRRLREERVVTWIGAGMNQPQMLTRFVRNEDIDTVLVAGRWTLLDRSAGDELLPLCEQTGVRVVVGGVFNSGVLADPRPGATFDYAPADAPVVATAQRMARVCAARGISLRAAALRFAARQPSVVTVLTGARSATEMAGNAADFARPIPDELWPELEACRR